MALSEQIKGPLYHIKETQILHPPKGKSGVFLRIVALDLQSKEQVDLDFAYESVQQMIGDFQKFVDTLKERHT